MASDIVDVEVKVTELNSAEAKGELRDGDEVITWYIPLSNFCQTLEISEDSEKVKELISSELKGTLKAKVDKWTVLHYVIETSNFTFFLPKEKKQFEKTCMYPFIKSSYFKHRKDYHSNKMLEKLQELTIGAVNVIRKRSARKEETGRIKEELAKITMLFIKNEIDLALKRYDIWLKTSLVRGRLSIEEFEMLHNISKNAKKMSSNIKALLWLIPYKMKKKVGDDGL